MSATVVLVAVLMAGCTGESATPSSPPASEAAGVAGSAAEIQGGEGACTEALREGPLIDPDDSTLGEPPPGAQPLPIVNLPRLDTCELTSTADWVGQPFVLNFWASWCGPCREEMPVLDEFHHERGDQVDVIGVTIDFRPSDATDFLEEVPVAFDSWFDPDRQVLANRVSVRAMPTTLFVDADGMIVHRHHGPLTRGQLDSAVAEHLAPESS